MPRSFRSALWSVVAGLAVLVACPGPAHAQTVIVGQPQLTFAASPGGNSTVQALPIQVTGSASIPYLVTFTPSSGGNWLYFSPSFGDSPSTVLVMASASQLSQGTYSGVLTITAPASNNSPVNIPVTFSVGQSTLGSTSVSPSALTFTAQVNGTAPLAQLVSVSAFSSPFSFTVSATTSNSIGWLQVAPTFGSAPATLSVSVQPQGLSTGYYFGSVTVTPSVGTPVSIPVTLLITTGGTLNFSTSNLQFYYQVGALTPGAQTVMVYGDTAAPVNFSLAPSTTVGSWLNAAPLQSVAPQTVTVSVNPSGLAPGVYTGNIAVAAGTAQTVFQNIAVTLTVANGTLLTLGTPPAPFTYTTGGTPPASQAVLVDSTSGILNFSVTAATTGGNWLTVGPLTGTTPQTLAVGVNTSGLTAGVYSGLVTVTSAGAVNTPQAFPVTLSVNTVQTLSASPSGLNFNYQLGTSTPVLGQSLQVTTALPAVVGVSVSTTNCGNWLVPAGVTVNAPGLITITVNTTGLTTSQVCTGAIILTLNGTSTVQVPVTLNVSQNALLNITPTSLDFTVNYSPDTIPTQTLNLATTDGSSMQFFAATGLNSNWLNASPSNGKAPGTVVVSVYPGSLSPGKYTGAVTFASSGLVTQQSVPVTMTVKPATTTSSRPTALSFTQAVGGVAPPSQQIAITTTNGSFPYTATPSTTGGLGWLKLTGVSGTSPGVVTVSAVPTGLGIGTYSGSVLVSVPGSSNDPLVVPVSFTITSSTGIGATPTALAFSYQLGSLFSPGDQVITVSSTGGVVNYSVGATTASGSGNWLTTTPTTANTPSTVTVTVNPSGLGVGTYTGQVSITAPGIVGSPLLIPVTLTVQPQPAPVISSLTNAASGASGAIAVGEIVTLKGSGMGPTQGLGPVVNAAGKVDTTVAFTRVLFDGYAAPILYTSRTQINAVVPYEVSGRNTVQVQVENQGLRSLATTANTISSAPGIFTADSTGTGQGSVLNQDSTVNSIANPAKANSVIQVFATGEGQTDPVGVTGSIAGATLPKPVLAVSAKVAGLPAEVTYYGAAPQSVAGLFQVNVKLPDGVTGDNVKLEIKVGDAPSQLGVTVAIR